MNSTDTNRANVPTDLDILGSGIVFRDVRKIWMKRARAFMRLELLKHLQSEDLGLQQIENFVKNEAKFRQSHKFQSKDVRNVSQI